MAEISSGPISLLATWNALGRLLAVAAAAATALISLYHGVSLDVACLRGALALVGLSLVVRAGAFAIERAARAEARQRVGAAKEGTRA